MRRKILFQLNEMAFGGTTKAILTFCRYLNRQEFEPFLFCHSDEGSLRYYRRWLESFLSEGKRERFETLYLRHYVRKSEFEECLGKDHLFYGDFQDLQKCVKAVQPHLLHFNRGDFEDFYTSKVHRLPAHLRLVETSIFGQASQMSYLAQVSRFFFVSEWLKQKSSWAGEKGVVLYNPILPPATTSDLRGHLEISPESFVVGRISRPGLDSGEKILQIFDQVKDSGAFLVVIGGGEVIRARAARDASVKCLPSTTDECELSKFYNTLDLLLHYRQEGETFGMNIAEAMIHGKPVVSHRSAVDNAQAELLDSSAHGEVGFVAEPEDRAAYVAAIQRYRMNPELRRKAGENARKRANDLFAASRITRRLEEEYCQLVN